MPKMTILFSMCSMRLKVLPNGLFNFSDILWPSATASTYKGCTVYKQLKKLAAQSSSDYHTDVSLCAIFDSTGECSLLHPLPHGYNHSMRLSPIAFAPASIQHGT